MAVSTQKPAPVIVWADKMAAAIPDPVWRLRFLQAVVEFPGSGRKRRSRRIRFVGLAALVAVPGMAVLLRPAKPGVPPAAVLRPVPRPVPEVALPRDARQPAPAVWLVESSAESETYSNGLRVDNRSSTSNRPRAYHAFPAGDAGGDVARRETPAGIVFHISESAQAPFEASRNGVLKKIGESLLDYVRRQHAYNFVIDRFGRVHRVVRESDVAHHAGYSLWADERWIYINLNESFLGVAFEGRSQAEQSEPVITAAQVRAGGDLTEMLRARFDIPAGNCVTHAQVSVNPSNRRVGYHTDWSYGFPYEQIGLPDNYRQTLPSVALFGFECDQAYLEAAGPDLKAAVEDAERRIAARAADAGIRPEDYRKRLQRDYRFKLAAAEGRAGAAPP